MAEKKRKTQAEKAAKTSKKPAVKSSDSIAAKKAKTDSGNAQVEKAKSSAALVPDENVISPRFLTALTFLILFIVFLVASFAPEGALIEFFSNIAHGLFGSVGFFVCIPAFLYAFLILAFGGKRPVAMRCLSLLAFVLCCGGISHLVLNPGSMGSGISVIGSLYTGGITGATAGVICGGTAMLLCWLCGRVISYILFVVIAVFALLASMQITVPSIIRAIKNRPRADWEEEYFEQQPEPATVVVNHLATKRIEHIEQKRKREADRVTTHAEPAPVTIRPASSAVAAHQPDNKVQDMFRQIDADVATPVVAASAPAIHENTEAEFIIEQSAAPTTVQPEQVEPEFIAPQAIAQQPVPAVTEAVPHQMPPLQEGTAAAHTSQIVKPVKKERVSAQDAAVSAAIVAMEVAQDAAVEKPPYCFPPLALLKKPGISAADGTAEMRENTNRLNDTLQSFKIEARIINVTRGPSVTRYEVELEKGVRLNKLTAVADDIALSLGASGVRIAAVPGKISVVGIEVPNRNVTTVSLQEVIGSTEFNCAKSKSSFAIGKDIGGSCIIGNIAKLPHMLIAGTTGSGKSVCMNSIIISLLYKARPDEVKLIMVDPKMVELGIYNGIPHLLIPVVTDPKKAAGSLQWAVTEMMRRYRSMSDMGVRDLESYNSIVESQGEGEKLPQVVVIIDELADLMLVAAKEVEESICRIAQMGRAAGIHLIIATQRPSADVITGLMKANIPSRIAFAVASAMESRIILDTMGAEKLVGKGDMLYAPIGSGKPLRVQGCFVSDQEVENVTKYVKENGSSSYDQTVMEEIERKAVQTGNSGKAAAQEQEADQDESGGDEMLPAAVEVILETGQASVSMLQRRLKLGYARAARIVDEMEERGIVGPFQGSKPRAILITKEQWYAASAGQQEQMEISGVQGFDGGDSSGTLI